MKTREGIALLLFLLPMLAASQNAITVDSSGNVGVNRDPESGYQLDVSGNARVSGNVTATGKIGVNTTPNPDYALDVVGNARVSGNVEITGVLAAANIPTREAMVDYVVSFLETCASPTLIGIYDDPTIVASLTLSASYRYVLFMCIGAGGAGGAVDHPHTGYSGYPGASSGVKTGDGASWLCEAKGGNGGGGATTRTGVGAAPPSGGVGGFLCNSYAGGNGSINPEFYDGTGGYGGGTAPADVIKAIAAYLVVKPSTGYVAGSTGYMNHGNGYAGIWPGGGGSGAGYDHSSYYAGAGGGSGGQLRLYSVRPTGQSVLVVVGAGGTCPYSGMDRYGGPGAKGAVIVLGAY